MKPYRVHSLNAEVAHAVRRTRADDFGNALTLDVARSTRGICRRCLHRFRPGETRILFKYRPFAKESVFAEAGPIYIHEHDCQPATDVLARYPAEFRDLPLLLRGYNSDDGQVTAALIGNDDAEAIIDRFFANLDVAYIHLRDGEYGCYIARIERAGCTKEPSGSEGWQSLPESAS